jgi:hypothetical protein
MVQYIKQGNIFGRIGTGIGKGLGDQAVKEIEHQRLSSGLKQLGKKSGDLSPTEFLTEAYSTYGITPQMVQSLGEAAKYQRQTNAYNNSSNGKYKSSPDLIEGKEENGLDQDINSPFGIQSALNSKSDFITGMGATTGVNNKQRTPNMERAEDTPQVIPGNPLNQQNLPKTPWKPQQRNSVISNYIDQGFLPDEAKQLAADDESRDLGEPEVYKQRQEDIKTAKSEARDVLRRHLETKLQKTGENLFKDIEGPMLLNAERGMIRDLIKNPKSDIDNVANDWSERLYRTAIAKDKLRTFGKTTGWENFFKGNSSEKKLMEYREIFKKSGNLEEFNNILQGPNFGMSAQGSSSVTYPPNKKIEEYAYKIKNTAIPIQMDQKARKTAIEIGKDIGPDDSLLSIARKFSEKDPFFDQQAFFDQISEDKDELGLNERQRLELAQGSRNILPNWGDLLFLPIFRR